MTVDVPQRDNVTITPETIKPVFRNGRSGEVWNKVILDRMFRSFCRRSGMDVRGPNQTRHTFASRMLTVGLPPHVLAHLMGHTGEQMIRRHYAKWLDDDMDGRVAKMTDTAIATNLLPDGSKEEKLSQFNAVYWRRGSPLFTLCKRIHVVSINDIFYIVNRLLTF